MMSQSGSALEDGKSIFSGLCTGIDCMAIFNQRTQRQHPHSLCRIMKDQYEVLLRTRVVSSKCARHQRWKAMSGGVELILTTKEWRSSRTWLHRVICMATCQLRPCWSLECNVCLRIVYEAPSGFRAHQAVGNISRENGRRTRACGSLKVPLGDRYSDKGI